jgi:hypothetical protein
MSDELRTLAALSLVPSGGDRIGHNGEPRWSQSLASDLPGLAALGTSCNVNITGIITIEFYLRFHSKMWMKGAHFSVLIFKE